MRCVDPIGIERPSSHQRSFDDLQLRPDIPSLNCSAVDAGTTCVPPHAFSPSCNDQKPKRMQQPVVVRAKYLRQQEARATVAVRKDFGVGKKLALTR